MTYTLSQLGSMQPALLIRASVPALRWSLSKCCSGVEHSSLAHPLPLHIVYSRRSCSRGFRPQHRGLSVPSLVTCLQLFPSSSITNLSCCDHTLTAQRVQLDVQALHQQRAGRSARHHHGGCPVPAVEAPSSAASSSCWQISSDPAASRNILAASARQWRKLALRRRSTKRVALQL